MNNASGAEADAISPHQSNYIVSTDLDGTLLDHDTYEWHPAQPALDKLNSLAIPVVINTSKTYQEVRLLQKEIGLQAPFIVENGSAIYLPQGQFPQPENARPQDEYWCVLLGSTRAEVESLLKNLRTQYLFKFESFFDMSRERVMELTGLSAANADFAMHRLYSEPIVWHDSPDKLARFTTHINKENKRLLQGGRFIHILGDTNKAIAIEWLLNHLQYLQGKRPKLIALGDSGNDIAMLNVADYAVAVRSPAHAYPTIHTSGELIQTQGFGPSGWCEAITQILK